MEPHDELVHDYPRPLTAHWKENWYFNFIDPANNAWGINHISLMRHRGQGRFSAFHVVDGEQLMYSNLIDIDDNFQELSDGRLCFEFVEPFERFSLSFDGPRHQVKLDYRARFPFFDYAMAKHGAPGRDKAMTLQHYEQALTVRGSITKDGQTREIDCLGHRDHSWGFRNESKITGWNWVAAQFPDKTINLYRAVIGKAFIGSGFVSSAEGNIRIARMNIEHTEFENNVPISSTYLGHDQNGKAWRLKSKKFSGLYLPMQEKGDGVVVHENFADFEIPETGERGVGIDEYLINPA